jgi:DNA-binding response OmpR family regulator
MSRILLVDDDEIIRKALGDVLRLQSFDVTCLSDGSRVVKEITMAHYDIIIMDIIMPDKEGLETIKDIRKMGKDIPILAISGGGKTIPEVNLSTAQMLGATDVLLKPFDSITLIQKIRELLEDKKHFAGHLPSMGEN